MMFKPSRNQGLMDYFRDNPELDALRKRTAEGFAHEKKKKDGDKRPSCAFCCRLCPSEDTLSCKGFETTFCC